MAKQWTDEERKAFGDKMKAARAAKENQNPQPQTAPITPPVSEEDVDTGTQDVVNQGDNDRVARLEAQIEMLMKMQLAQSGQQANQNAPAKTVEKYSLDLSHYDTPVPKLIEWASTDRKMQQVGFLANYELQFVAETPPRYQLADGSWERQPKFTLGLLEFAYDDDGNPQIIKNPKGEEVQIKYLRKRLVFFEDPDYALSVANRMGLVITDETSQQFLNDMKYLQAREWLLEYFYPPKMNFLSGPVEVPISGQMVTIVETPTDLNKIEVDHKLRV